MSDREALVQLLSAYDAYLKVLGRTPSFVTTPPTRAMESILQHHRIEEAEAWRVLRNVAEDAQSYLAN